MASRPADSVPSWRSLPLEAPPGGPLPKKVLELEHAGFRQESFERLRMQESLAQACFRSLVLVNGGAIIALFTLIGSNAAIARQAPGPTLWLAFAAFAAGLAATVFGNAAGFAMQVHYATMTERQMWNKELELAGRPPAYDVERSLYSGDWWQKAAVASVALALAFFGIGAALCFLAFLG